MPHQQPLPKKNALLKYLKLDRLGRLTYERKIPARLREFLGDRASIRRSLGVDGTDCSDTAVLTAYARVHGQVQGAIDAAEAQQLQKSTAIQAQPQTFALSPRDVAGIAANPLLEMRNALADGRITMPIQAELQKVAPDFLAQVVWTCMTGDTSHIQGAFAQLTQPLLDQLGISPNETDITAITQRLLAYAADARADVEKLQHGDWSSPMLAAKAPPIPKRRLTWEQLIDGWRRSVGGTLEIDGYGVSERRVVLYRLAIKDFVAHITDAPPEDITIADVQRYLKWLQTDSGNAPRTQAGKLICLKNLVQIAVNNREMAGNPFEGFKIVVPAGAADLKGYRPFTKQELVTIFTAVKKESREHNRLLPYILLLTGCRLAEAAQLRTKDIQQTEQGTWFINWEHEPLGIYPMLLKTKDSNNRKMPMHQRLIDEGLLDIDRAGDGRLFESLSQNTNTYSTHFMELLKRLDIWEKKKTVAHSFRNNAKDMWREADISLDVRNAFTGHAAVGVGERSYGVGLGQMPDKLNEYVKRINVSWLP